MEATLCPAGAAGVALLDGMGPSQVHRTQLYHPPGPAWDSVLPWLCDLYGAFIPQTSLLPILQKGKLRLLFSKRSLVSWEQSRSSPARPTPAGLQLAGHPSQSTPSPHPHAENKGLPSSSRVRTSPPQALARGKKEPSPLVPDPKEGVGSQLGPGFCFLAELWSSLDQVVVVFGAPGPGAQGPGARHKGWAQSRSRGSVLSQARGRGPKPRSPWGLQNL